MVHLGPLPGAPRFGGDLKGVIEAAVADGRTLAEAGFDALLVENFGDSPFIADDVSKVTVAAMTRAVDAVAAIGIPCGVNVLRNDALSALSIAAATGARFIRVNILSGTMHTDQGTITGKAADLARLRAALGVDVKVFADVFVKHATPPPGLTLEQASLDLWNRAAADALVLTGKATGDQADVDEVKHVASVVPDALLYVGSGVDPKNVAGFLDAGTGVIVGTSLKIDGNARAPVDPARAKALVSAARR
jgi:membrane complex biogenesis BtpA family protein